MKVQIVSFNCVLKNKLGKIISSTSNRDVLAGADPKERNLKVLEKHLLSLRSGEKKKFEVPASEAYGFYDPNLILTVPRQSLPAFDNLKVNQPLNLEMDGAQRMYRVVGWSSETVTLDGNHPLAGQDLVFEIEALSIREPTAEELYEITKDEGQPLLH